jgi:hypothetical protein
VPGFSRQTFQKTSSIRSLAEAVGLAGETSSGLEFCRKLLRVSSNESFQLVKLGNSKSESLREKIFLLARKVTADPAGRHSTFPGWGEQKLDRGLLV